MKRIPLLLITLAAALAPTLVSAQLAQKPSVYEARRQGKPFTVPAGADRKVAALRRIGSRRDFDRIARLYGAGTPHEITHALFVIDRQHGNTVYFINANRYALHEDFLRGQYLAASLDHRTLASFYANPARRFLLGTLGHRAELGRWAYEFWEGDRLTPALLATAQERLGASFFAPLVFKASSSQQESVGAASGIETVSEAAILGQRSYLPLNNGTAVGRLRRVVDLESESEDDIAPTDIVVLREVPLALPPVAGVLTERPSTVLSHVNVLAKGWRIPNAFVKDAFAQLAPFEGQWVRLRVDDDAYTIERAEPAAPALRARPAGAVRPPELRTAALQPLARLRSASTSFCGGKAATLGEIERLRRAGRIAGIAEVPDGFCIPFAQYIAFMQREPVRERIREAFATPGFERSRVVRRRALETLRGELAAMPVDAATAASWVAQWRSQLAGRGAFVRSSSNAEDLPDFSGAGLFSTVPNVMRDDALVSAVLTVWASVFNFEAVEARRQAGIASEAVAMGVFVQTAVASVTSGVMVTRDPFDATHRNAVYVSAKRGIGIKVVEGRRVAEQSMFDARSGAVRRLTRSAEDSALQLDANGGVVETAIAPGEDVLSDAAVRALAKAGASLKAQLRHVEQDIEWAIDDRGRVVILQARPFLSIPPP
jgi:hypothetical protein